MLRYSDLVMVKSFMDTGIAPVPKTDIVISQSKWFRNAIQLVFRLDLK